MRENQLICTQEQTQKQSIMNHKKRHLKPALLVVLLLAEYRLPPLGLDLVGLEA